MLHLAARGAVAADPHEPGGVPAGTGASSGKQLSVRRTVRADGTTQTSVRESGSSRWEAVTQVGGSELGYEWLCISLLDAH